MLTLTANPFNRAFAVRPVCKGTDRSIIRELFRQEFYGSTPQNFPDEGLWEIYDSMGTNDIDVFGAYLVSYRDRLLFLLEVHPPVQLDLPLSYLVEPGTIGVYCFYTSPDDPMNLPAFRTCVGCLLEHPSVYQIFTAINPVSRQDPRLHILEKCGFHRLPESYDRTRIYRCSMESYPLFGDHAGMCITAVNPAY